MLRGIVVLAFVLLGRMPSAAHAQENAANVKFEIMPIAGFRSAASTPEQIPANGPGSVRTRAGGLMVGAHAKARILANLSVFATGAHSSWHNNPPADLRTDTLRGGHFRWLVAGLSLDIKLKNIVPLSVVLGPGIVEERYPSNAPTDVQDSARHRMFAFGLEALFPLRGALIARGSLRDQLVWWQDESYGRSHIVVAHMGIGWSW